MSYSDSIALATKYITNNQMKEAADELSNLVKSEKPVDDLAAPKVHDLVKAIADIFENVDSLNDIEVLKKSGPILPLLKKLITAYESKDDEEELYNLYDDMSQIANMAGDFTTSVEYAKKYVKVQENSEDQDSYSHAIMACSNAIVSAALEIAANALEIIMTTDNENHEVDIPDDMKEKAENYLSEAVDYFHQAYILNLKLAIESAAEMKLVDKDLVNKLDDDNITASVQTLTDAIDNADKNEELNQVIDYIETAMEMNEKCAEYDGMSFEELIDQVNAAYESADCDCDDCCGGCCDDCKCGESCHHDEEEEEEEEEKSNKRSGCHNESACKRCKH